MSFFRLIRQILQSKSGIFGEKSNEVRRKKGFFIAKGLHRNKSEIPAFGFALRSAYAAYLNFGFHVSAMA